MKILVGAKIQTQVRRKSDGKILKRSPWIKNLVLDTGLNSLAKRTGANAHSCVAANLFSVCTIGSGSNANSFSSGAVTFTQAGTTVTASANFFTAAMVGGIFKYGIGTAGAEYYITAFTSATQVTVDTAATVGTPTVANVWMVQQTACQTPIASSSTYQTTGGSNGTTTGGTQIVYKRTFVFGVGPYTVNEVCYGSQPGPNPDINGRIVLGSSDVVGASNFYVVVIQLTLTYAPSSPTAVGDVGTNINTAGNAMVEWWNISTVNSSGVTVANQGDALDNAGTCFGTTATYTQSASNIQNAAPFSWNANNIQLGASTVDWVYTGGTVGKCTKTFNYSVSTSGQTMYGIGIGQSASGVSFDIKLTTPFVLPSGTFQGNLVWQLQFSRTLNNV